MHARVSLLLPALAFTAVASLADAALASAPQDTVYLHGIPYGADGAYFHSGNFYNDMPVYTLDHADTTWSLYQRSNGRWYVDFNDVGEDWDGTVAIGPDAISPTHDEWQTSGMVVLDATNRPIPLRGRHDFGTFTTGTDCRDITFAAPFDGDDVNVQLSIDHANGPGNHDATTIWAEGVDRGGARICVRETSNFDGSHDANLSVSYVAYRPGALLDGEAGRFEDSDGFTGTSNHCNTIEFDQTFAFAPVVQVTVTHGDSFSGNNGAITAWLEQVTTTEFVVCVRETAEQAADHPAYAIDWIAHESSSWPFYGVRRGRGRERAGVLGLEVHGRRVCDGLRRRATAVADRRPPRRWWQP